MSLVVAIKKDGIIYVGADSAISAEANIARYPKDKIFRIGKFLFGVTGNVGAVNRMRLDFERRLPARPKSYTDEQYMQFRIAERIKYLLEETSHYNNEKDKLECFGILVGYNHNLYEINEDLDVFCIDDFEVFGPAGASEWAKGFMRASSIDDPEQLILATLEEIETNFNFVRRPFIIEKLEC